MVRRHASPAPRRRALCASAALVALLGCAGGSSVGEGSPQPVGMPGEGPPPPLGELVAGGPERLADLQDRLKVPGLDDRRFSHADLWAAIEPYIGRAVSDRVVGESAEGRSIPLLTYGSGPIPILLWSQMHGNESTATMALADMVRFFDEYGDDPLARTIAEGATVYMIPMLNPDGADRFQRRNAQGIDVNRDARRLQTPEGQVLKAVRDEVEPAFGFNLHDQAASLRVGDSNRGVAIALLAPAFNAARDVDPKRRRAMQVSSFLIDAMEPLVGDHIAKYDDTYNPRAFGDLMGAWGASTILIESGAWPRDPQKQYLRKTNFVGILLALGAIADGSYANYGPEAYEALSFNGRRLTDLLIRGGTIAIPGRPPLTADMLANYDRPILGEGARITDIGDMGLSDAQDTLDVSGLYLIPTSAALDDEGGLNVGAPARFVVAEDPEGQRIHFVFEGRREDVGRR
ncbi:MAG: M14 family zinc carboxypeptidase [Gemmatimonadota bacterium]